MSTYTDLHNKLRENVAVDYRTRETDRPLKFKCEQNEYWGTFKGTLSAHDIQLSGGNLFGMTSYGETLVDAVLKTGDRIIDLGGLGAEVQQISDKADTALDRLDGHDGDIDYLSGRVDQVSSAISSAGSDISDFKEATNRSLSCLSGMVSAETSARIQSVAETSAALDDKIGARVASEAASREAFDRLLKGDIDQEVEDRKTAVEASEAASKAYSDIRRHYGLYSGSMTGPEFPIESKDFCVNLLTKLHMTDGDVFDADTDIRIGAVRDMDPDEKTVTLAVVKNLPERYRSALHADKAYEFEYDGHQIIEDTGYYIKASWTDNRPSFEVDVYDRDIYDIYADVGGERSRQAKVTGYEAQDGKIISGYFTSQATEPTLAVFNGIQRSPFYWPNYEISCPGMSEYTVKYLGDNEFQYKIGRNRFDYVTVSGSDPVQYMGKVFQKDVVSSQAGLSRFVLELSGGTHVELLSSEDFYRELSESERISCEQVEGGLAIDHYRDVRFYEYGFCNEAQLISDQLCGTVRILEPRVMLSDDFACPCSAMISAVLKNIPSADTLPYELKYDHATGVWSTTQETLSDNIQVVFDKVGLSVTVYSLTEEKKRLEKQYAVRQLVPMVYRDDSIHQVSNPVSFSFDQSQPGSIISAYATPGSSQEDKMNFKVSEGASRFTVCIHDRTEEQVQSKAMREAVYVIRPVSDSKVSAEAEIRFVNDRMEPVKFFNGRLSTLFVPVNRYTTVRMQEISPDVFVTLDLDQNQQEGRLDWLTERLFGLSGEVSAVSSFLSSEISANNRDISAISGAVDYLSSEISANDRDISGLSGAVRYLSGQVSSDQEHIKDLYRQISGGLSYKDTIDLRESDKGRTLSGLFFKNFQAKPYPLTPEQISSMPMRQGFYYIAQNAGAETQVCCFEGLSVEHGDWIVMRENCLLSDMTSAQVSIVDMMDYDVFRLSAGGQVVVGNNEFRDVQKFEGLSADHMSAAFECVIDPRAAKLSSFVKADETQAGVYFAISEILRQTGLKIEFDDASTWDQAANAVSAAAYMLDVDVGRKPGDLAAVPSWTYGATVKLLGQVNIPNGTSLKTELDRTWRKFVQVDGRLGRLTESLSGLSGEVSAVSSFLSSEISANDRDISCISVGLSGLSAEYRDFYDCTFVKSQHPAGDISSDLLVLTDETELEGKDNHHHKKYRLTMLSGTLVLQKICCQG